MSENIKKSGPTVDDVKKPTWDRPTVASTVAKKPDGLPMTSAAATAIGIFLGLRAVGVGQQRALLTSTSLVYLMSLPIVYQNKKGNFFDMMP